MPEDDCFSSLFGIKPKGSKLPQKKGGAQDALPWSGLQEEDEEEEVRALLLLALLER